MLQLVRHQVAVPIRGRDARAAARQQRRDARRAAIRRLRPVEPSRKNELFYLGQLMAIVSDLRAAGRQILAAARPLFDGRGGAQDAIPRSLKHDISRAREANAIGRGAGAELAADVVARNLDEVDARLAGSVDASIGVDIRAALTESETSLLAAAKREALADNVDLIVSIPEQYFDSIEQAVGEAWDAGLSYDKLSEAIQHIGDVTESRADLISRDQTSKLNASFNEARQTSIGITRYEWQTADDELVRDSHADLDGQTFEWDDPPLVDGENVHPGEAINCRCKASPIVDSDALADVDDFAEAA